jgi:hypothetical protein
MTTMDFDAPVLIAGGGLVRAPVQEDPAKIALIKHQARLVQLRRSNTWLGCCNRRASRPDTPRVVSRHPRG